MQKNFMKIMKNKKEIYYGKCIIGIIMVFTLLLSIITLSHFFSSNIINTHFSNLHARLSPVSPFLLLNKNISFLMK